MPLLRKITSNVFVLTFVIFVITHLALLNINKAEWGDSYRILRASNYVRMGTYPLDEKRPPLFSIALAIRPSNIDPIYSARIFMFILSLSTFVLFYNLLKCYVKDKTVQLFILMAYIFNPVYLYWSLRIYADTFFAFFALLVFSTLLWIREKPSLFKYVLLGLLCGLSVITRFEGYLLTVSVGLALLFQHTKKEDVIRNFFRQWKVYFVVVVSFLVPVIPYFLYKNPLTSSYIGEPSGRTYDLKMVWTFIASLLYLFGFTSAFYFLYKSYKDVRTFLANNLFVTIFVSLELILVLLWPAAVPRLFAATIPFLLITLGVSLDKTNIKSYTTKDYLILIGLLSFYAVSQYFIKGQFLIVNKFVFAVIVVLQLFSIFALYIKNKYIFLAIAILSASIWSFITIYMHKDIYMDTMEAALYADKGNPPIIHNDINSIIEWYAGDNAYFCDKDLSEVKTCIYKYDAKIVIFTNDSNINEKFEASKYPYLKLIQEYKDVINGGSFDAQVYAVDKGKML